MKFNINQERSEVKQELLLSLIPAFTVKEIIEMTGLTQNSIGYYRRKTKTASLSQIKKKLEAEAQQNIRDRLEHNREYALSVVEDLLHDNGIPYE